ncbi:hypothetical protein GCM10020366_26630 [Saccharopolyspora gregorii]|uniref:Uncharacterized protein n=1 Tax=Saccharopolyspora gregorii TaxID=33914 RepID=A0ABP6RN90_9PSEU
MPAPIVLAQQVLPGAVVAPYPGTDQGRPAPIAQQRAETRRKMIRIVVHSRVRTGRAGRTRSVSLINARTEQGAGPDR